MCALYDLYIFRERIAGTLLQDEPFFIECPGIFIPEVKAVSPVYFYIIVAVPAERQDAEKIIVVNSNARCQGGRAYRNIIVIELIETVIAEYFGEIGRVIPVCPVQ